MKNQPTILDRFRGCLLGLAVGDALGSPFEGIDGYGIYKAFGPSIEIVRHPPVDELQYTDDTEMMIGLAEALIEKGHVDEETLAQAYAKNYDPRRGYGHGAKKLLQAIRDGEDWRRMATSIFPGGSLGNGAAMRVAPVGLLFHTDLDRVELEAEASALITHRHPVGIDGARTIALAVAMAMQPDRYDRAAFFGELRARVKTEEFRQPLARAASADESFSPLALGDSVEAHRSVPSAVCCFDQNQSSYAQTVSGALRVGGDTDTICAMAGAIAGARVGMSGIPPHLLAMLENGERGREYVDQLAHQLFERWRGASTLP